MSLSFSQSLIVINTSKDRFEQYKIICREENKNYENIIDSQQPKEYSNSTYVAANFAHERRNLFDEEPIAIDPNAGEAEATAFVDIDA